ncbi:hypothetical protein GFL85_13825 [Rhizobium laguerreae]|uniref:hypothetical protein n=1 Tax=Rhizobium laguerreae TaxID=1076926 RepID=UPI00143FA7F3|nr:hypothetical protein [Rhizobium laguerreae]NKM12098.1 hypothetical protein [Rhizobium laguerreae]
MTLEEFVALYAKAIDGIDSVGWHWFGYHFYNGPRPFARGILSSCASINRKTDGIGTELLEELVGIGGRDRDERQYEQLLQKLSEILVIERVVNCPWPEGTTFRHEPAAIRNGPRPELLVSWPEGRLVMEVKTPALLNHVRARGANGVQLAYRGGIPLDAAREIAEGEVTLPRDNPILDFLRDGERKFAAFREDCSTSSLLVIVWDDHIYEPISTLVNAGSGLLTPNSFAQQADGTAEAFPNVDNVILVRHLNYFVSGSREEALMDRENAMDFGNEHALPNVLCEGHGGRPIPTFVLDVLRAYPHDDPGLRMFAEYNPQDMVFWIGVPPHE